MTVRRRRVLAGAAWIAGFSLLPRLAELARAAAPLATGPAEPFDFAALVRLARGLSKAPPREFVDETPPQLRALDYDRYRRIVFRPDHALWHDRDLAFRAQFFHLGLFFRQKVRIFEVVDGRAREIAYDPAMFDYGGNRFDPPLPADLGFAGFRLHFHTDFRFDMVAFQGASYFRAVDGRNQYGLSARGLAIDTGLPRPEEFPLFTRFWLVRPAPTETTVTVWALLESRSVTGAYRFLIAPGGRTVMEVEARLFPRRPIERLGIAPLTSMFQCGENDRRVCDDWRPEIHDSDGLALWTGAGERIWRPLVNPAYLRVSSFLDENPRGFGLLQRDQRFESYQDTGARYHLRPGAWVEPLGGWGRGAVLLVEIPTPDEAFDNIVAFWKPERPVRGGEELTLRYRLVWGADPVPPADLARARATRIGRGGVVGRPRPPRTAKFVVDFAGGPLSLLPGDAPLVPVVTASHGEIPGNEAAGSRRPGAPAAFTVPEAGIWRVVFDYRWRETRPVDLRLYLRLGHQALSETWLYQWDPPAA